jgi:small-conductance mechanosensitive channel
MGDSLSSGVNLFGIRLAGFSGLTGHKLLLSLGFTVVLFGVSYCLRWLSHVTLRNAAGGRPAFWTRQTIKLLTAALFVIGLASIWFDDPGRMATAAGLVTAGIAVALQRVITSFAAYLIVLRGRVFTVGDRITIGGVRGDVVALGFMQTTVMEMGEPVPSRDSEPGAWVAARQYTGRLVRVTNDKIFDTPVFNYTQQFPYFWEEIHLPVRYGDDRHTVERILLDAARRHTQAHLGDAARALEELRNAYALPEAVQLEPHSFARLTDNWIELTVRFVVPQRGVRSIKDAVSRDVLKALDEAGIGVASTTYEIVGLPTLHIDRTSRGELSRANGAD